jgi:hypothetical protein
MFLWFPCPNIVTASTDRGSQNGIGIHQKEGLTNEIFIPLSACCNQILNSSDILIDQGSDWVVLAFLMPQ